MKKTKIIQKSKLKTVILVLLLALPMTSNININSIFSKANQEVETLNTSAEVSMPVTPKYEYAYENDFDYYYHYTQSPKAYSEESSLVGSDTEWSQDSTDAEKLQLYYACVFPSSGGSDAFTMDGCMLVISHNTFKKQSAPNLGAYVDWTIDVNNPYLDDLDIDYILISLSILKPNKFEELVTIEDLNPQEGTFYLANFSQYIWADGRIRFALRGLVYGNYEDRGGIVISINFEGLRVVQEIKPIKSEAEKRTLILVHGFAFDKTYFPFWNTYLYSLEFNEAYDKIIVISYLGDYIAYKFSKSESGNWEQDQEYDLYVDDTSLWTSINDLAAGLALYIIQDLDYVGDNVDIICHSMGGLVTRFMIKHFYLYIQAVYATLGRNFKIHNVCTIATPNHGVWYGWLSALVLLISPLPLPTQIFEMAPGSPFLTALNYLGVYPGTEIPLSGIYINWFTYRSGIFEILGIRHDGIVGMLSVPLDGATNKGIYDLGHTELIASKMMNRVVFNDIFKPPEIVQTIFDSGTPGKIIKIEDLTIEGTALSITLPIDIATDIEPNSVYIEINPKCQMILQEGTTDTYEVELPLTEGDYSFVITANDLDGGLYQISGNLKILPDVTSPIIIITSPTDGLITNQDVTLTYTVSDDYTDISDITIIGPVSGTPYNSEGFHDVTITATDEAGNTVSETVSFTIDKTAPVIDITSPIDGLITNEAVELVYTVSDDVSTPADIVVIGPESGDFYTSEGTHTVEITATDEAGNSVSETIFFVIDQIKPVTLILFGAPHLEINNIVHINSTTPIELLPLDFSTVTGTFYMVSNDTFDSGWISYEDKFSLDSLILYDGEYKIHYYSTDIAGNEEDHKYESVVLDNSPPTLNWEYEGTALQDGFLFEIEVGDATGVDESSIVVSIREHNGPIVADAIPGQFAEGLWQADKIFDTTTLPDGYYELIVDANDAFGFTTTQTFRFSIRNWAVLVLLPSTESNKAGRTMPVKFSLRVAFAVDPEMPFVVNQELDIFINDTATDEILQHSTYGDTSKDYRINVLTEQYITNFKTHKTPTTYFICIYRKDFFIGNFSFCTVK